MKTTDTILIADRNPHIRKFLIRELADSGYDVCSVDNANDLLQMIYRNDRIDLLVLDPDFPCMEALDLAHKIVDRVPQIPVVLHCVRGSDDFSGLYGAHAVQIEKNGQSVEILKETIHRLL